MLAASLEAVFGRENRADWYRLCPSTDRAYSTLPKISAGHTPQVNEEETEVVTPRVFSQWRRAVADEYAELQRRRILPLTYSKFDMRIAMRRVGLPADFARKLQES